MKKTRITNKKEMAVKIGDWPTLQITCREYQLGCNRLVIQYSGEQVTYINDDIKNVCWWAANTNGASMVNYLNLSNA